MTTVFRRFRRLDVLVACLTLVACVFVSEVWLPSFVHRSLAVRRLLAQPRDLVMLIYISHPGSGFRSESWAFHDADGLSRVRYTVVGPRGDALVTEPPSGRVDVPALFDAAKSYGLLGHASYGQGESHIYLAARVGKHWERHDVYFPTAELYAMRKREYHLDLARESPQSAAALVRMESVADPNQGVKRYFAQVRAFGTPAFRAACQAAQNQVK